MPIAVMRHTHDSLARVFRPWFCRHRVAALICLSTAAQAAAQPLDAAAIDALHRKVLEEVHAGGASADVESAAALARLYVEGAGVEQDRIVGCSWAELARAEAAVQQKDTGDGRFERLHAWACDSLGPEERQLAMEMVACPRYGPDPQSFVLDADRIADVGRRGVVIRRAAGERVEMLPVFGCPSRVALVRHTALERPDDRFLRTRHFLEVFAWTAGSADRESTQVLRWVLAEIEDDKFQVHTSEEIGEGRGGLWRPAPVPSWLADVGLNMTRDGAVRWRFAQLALSGEIDALPDIETLTPPPALPTAGTARVVATVLDRAGAPLGGAKVALSGVVSRTAISDPLGVVEFGDLPDGRYDVVASAEGLVPSLPQVFDLSGADARQVELVLKPYAPTQGLTIACGPGVGQTLAALGEGASLVLHVEAVGERTREESDVHLRLVTETRLRVLRTLKGHALGPISGGRLTVAQPGGRLDRGDYIEEYSYDPFASLRVGDEYVLFLTIDAHGQVRIHGGADGAFRIRNGRVRSAGSGRVAQGWKERSADAFFRALERQIR